MNRAVVRTALQILTMSLARETEENSMASVIHLALQAKGGVGKSMICARLLEYFLDRGLNVKGIDADPKSKTLCMYKSLPTEQLDLMSGTTINARRFDDLIEQVITQPAHYVVDNGTSSFVAMSNYFHENGILSLLEQNGVTVYQHVIVCGGGSIQHTIGDFVDVMKSTDKKNVVVWWNEYFGQIGHEVDKKFIHFSETKLFQQYADKILGQVLLSQRDPATYGRDIENMAKAAYTFKEAISESNLTIVARSRLNTVRREITEQLDNINFKQ